MSKMITRYYDKAIVASPTKDGTEDSILKLVTKLLNKDAKTRADTCKYVEVVLKNR